MTKEQKREKLIIHYKTLEQLARGAVARLDDRQGDRSEPAMSRICGEVNQRIENRLRLIGEVWRQVELPL